MLERIQHQALHDALTELANQRLLETRVDVALAGARRARHRVALLFVDLDGFKPINDGFGRDVGDTVLRAAGRAIRSAVRSEDTVARFGGDEFVVVLTNVRHRADIERSVNRIVDAVRVPIELGSDSVTLDASVGVACFPDDAHDYRSLLKYADSEMYRVKTQRREAEARARVTNP